MWTVCQQDAFDWVQLIADSWSSFQLKNKSTKLISFYPFFFTRFYRNLFLSCLRSVLPQKHGQKLYCLLFTSEIIDAQEILLALSIPFTKNDFCSLYVCRSALVNLRISVGALSLHLNSPCRTWPKIKKLIWRSFPLSKSRVFRLTIIFLVYNDSRLISMSEKTTFGNPNVALLVKL